MIYDLHVHRDEECDAAVRVSETGTESSAFWLPRSQISIERIFGDIYTIEVPDWLAEEKGIA